MFRLLHPRVSPLVAERIAAAVIGLGFMAACTFLGAAAVSTLPSDAAFLLGACLGMGWAVVGWAATKAFTRDQQAV